MKIKLEGVELAEETRRAVSAYIMWASWLGAIALTVYSVTGRAPRSIGVLVVLLIGTAIAASLVRSRYRLIDTIVEAFRVGLQLQLTDGAEEREAIDAARRAEQAANDAQGRADDEREKYEALKAEAERLAGEARAQFLVNHDEK